MLIARSARPTLFALILAAPCLVLAPAALAKGSRHASTPSDADCDFSLGSGCSYFQYAREKVLPAGLPASLGLPGETETDWAVAVLGLTMFTEARSESDASMAAVGATILNRAAYVPGRGKPLDPVRVEHAGANRQYSQWLLTHDILAGRPIPWIVAEARRTGTSLEAQNAANLLVLKDPVGYADLPRNRSPGRDFPQRLKRAVEIASCMFKSAELPGDGQDLAWIGEFGTLFSDPHKMSGTLADVPCSDHWHYLSKPDQSYCPGAWNRGREVTATGWCALTPNPVGKACGATWPEQHYYELREAHHGEAEVGAVHQEVLRYVAACRGTSSVAPNH